VADLFHDVPEKFRFPKLDLPPALTEMEMLQELQALADENDDLNHVACFLGAGAYNHFVPRWSIPDLARRVLHGLHARTSRKSARVRSRRISSTSR
jgi:glycine cleavage system pyridoxal-binding protein P